MKRLLMALVAASMVMSMAACSQGTETGKQDEGTAKQAYTAGTYTGVATGMKGEIKVEVTFSETEITDAKVVSHTETLGIGYGLDNTPVEQVPAQVVEYQTLAVDTITGATIITAAVKNAKRQKATSFWLNIFLFFRCFL